ncbi:hypothetical protein BDV98DRAFT_563898 [Pterulicium gracile]|uniref:FAD/NAD(P)-binding domain-containing protein n=1 Tax=Pterulicium gracile TaxID=1884261 RepID=A0A5C3QTY9_9AGAR|nr:hypothetical protein BDV98DRAFT_563898 [Pterula gracilis]
MSTDALWTDLHLRYPDATAALHRHQSLYTTFAVVITATLLFNSFALRKKWWAEDELANLGTPRSSPRLDMVVICGSGVSGLMAAKMCMTHFDEVVLIDPEFNKVLTGKSKSRVMQLRSVHAYLVLFKRAVTALFPSFEEKLIEVGGRTMNADFMPHFDGIYRPFDNTGYPKTFALRRHLLEPLLHRLLAADAESAFSDKSVGKLRVVQGTVKNVERGGSRINAVVGKGTDGKEFRIEGCDLVIDSSGGSQQGGEWLPALGFADPLPTRLVYNPHVRYMTITFPVSPELGATFPIPGGWEKSDFMYTLVAQPKIEHRGFLMAKMDNSTMQLCCSSWGPGDLPKNVEELVPHVESLRSTVPLPQWLKDTTCILATSAGDEAEFNFAKIPEMSNMQYHLHKDIPDNFVAVGDAAMRLNPIFGQGCAKATANVMQLDSMLRKTSRAEGIKAGFSGRYFKETQSRLGDMWEGTKAVDYGFLSTTTIKGETRDVGKPFRVIMELFGHFSEADPEISLLEWRVRHFLLPPTALFAPSTLARAAFFTAVYQSKRLLGTARPPQAVENCVRV